MKHPEIQKGTKIFYHGDMANPQGFGVVTNRYANEWGEFVDIKMEDGREKIRITIVAFSDKYLGNGLTRFVTLKAYNEYRRKFLTNEGEK